MAARQPARWHGRPTALSNAPTNFTTLGRHGQPWPAMAGLGPPLPSFASLGQPWPALASLIHVNEVQH